MMNYLFGLKWFGVAWYWYALALVAFVAASGCVLLRERQVGKMIHARFIVQL